MDKAQQTMNNIMLEKTMGNIVGWRPYSLRSYGTSTKRCGALNIKNKTNWRKSNMNQPTNFSQLEKLQEEQLPVPKHKLHDWTPIAVDTRLSLYTYLKI